MDDRVIPVVSLVIVSAIAGLILVNNLGTGVNSDELGVQISPTGAELNSSDQYRMAEYQNGILYGPYHIKGNSYYYHEGEVLGSDLEPRSNKKVSNLHSFYLETYLDPLFYAPTDSQGQTNLSGFERFESEKILTKRCGLEYDTVPADYLEAMEDNFRYTDSFLQHASMENAREVLNSNRDTLNGYTSYIGQFADNLDRDLAKNECFRNHSADSGIALVTQTESEKIITEETLANYSLTVNNNAQRLDREISSRNATLKNADGNVTFEKREITIKNLSYSYEDAMNATEARTEINQRRKDEIVQLEDYSSGLDQYDDRNNDSEEQEDSEDDEKNVSEINLTEEQKEELRLIDRNPRGYQIKPYCTEKDRMLVYGEQKNIYPNVIAGEDLVYRQDERYLQDFFTTCRCPYVEISRLNWYVIDDMNSDVEVSGYGGPLADKVEMAEENFRNYPGQSSMEQLSDAYDTALRKSIKQGELDSNLPDMWRKSQQADSKLHKFEAAYDDFYNDYHMDVWQDYFPMDGERNFYQSQYYYFLVMGSEYPMNFMTWSDSVWRLDHQPELFSGELEDDRPEAQES